MFFLRKKKTAPEPVSTQTERRIDKIIIHCSATNEKMDIGATEIKKWHTDPSPDGNGWNDIGYHYVIRRNGALELGRPENVIGSHVKNHNANSIGICLVGGVDRQGNTAKNFTPHQWISLEHIVRKLQLKYPLAIIHGHNEFAAKDCPSFDVQSWVKERGI